MIFFTSDLHLGHENCIRLCSKIGLAHPAIDPRISNTGADQLALGQIMFRHRLPPSNIFSRLSISKSISTWGEIDIRSS